MPINTDYPKTKSGVPLNFFAQINCSQMPYLKNFPSTGILLFFLGFESELNDDYDDGYDEGYENEDYNDDVDYNIANYDDVHVNYAIRDVKDTIIGDTHFISIDEDSGKVIDSNALSESEKIELLMRHEIYDDIMQKSNFVLESKRSDEDNYFLGHNWSDESDNNGFSVMYFANTNEEYYSFEEINEIIPFNMEKNDSPNYKNAVFKISGVLEKQLLLEDCLKSTKYYKGDIIECLKKEILDNSKLDEVLDIIDTNHDVSQIGGYPVFIQEDFRRDRKYKLLIQFDTVSIEGDIDDSRIEFIWGDCGIANFFISEKDLVNKNFSNVLYCVQST